MNDADIDLINKTFYPGWLMVSQLRSGQEVKDGEALYRRACRWVTAHQLITTLSAVLLKYEPRLSRINVVMQEQIQPGELRYAIDAELKGVGLVRYGTEFMPEGRVLIRHLKQQQYLDNTARV
ncbi:hypothetical protein [Enterobacter hormaechei]|uniref:hypothetical protein n=1 Tax=Enterobacter hormaechei TaxID=158836 RepID=UPI0037533D3D